MALLFASLQMVLPAFGFPPTPNAQPLYTSSLILQELKKTITKTSSASCATELVIIHCTLAIQLLYLCCEFGVPTVRHQ